MHSGGLTRCSIMLCLPQESRSFLLWCFKGARRGECCLMSRQTWYWAGLALVFGLLSGPITSANGDQCLTNEILRRWFKAEKFSAPRTVRMEMEMEAQSACAYMVERKGYSELRVREVLNQELGRYIQFLMDVSVLRGPTLKGLMLEAIEPGGAIARRAKKYPVVTIRFDVPPDKVFVNGEPVSSNENSFNVPLGNVLIEAEREGGASCSTEFISEKGKNYSVKCSFN